jgi:hypothetical protein
VVLLSFLAGLALVLAGTAVAAVRAVGLWRQVKQTGGVISERLATFQREADLAQGHLLAFERSNADLERALERLRGSRAYLQVLLDALERSQARLRWLRVFLPR